VVTWGHRSSRVAAAHPDRVAAIGTSLCSYWEYGPDGVPPLGRVEVLTAVADPGLVDLRGCSCCSSYVRLGYTPTASDGVAIVATMPNNSTYVLIPGAWHGGWAWHPVARRLRAAGHPAVALTLPGLTDGDDPRGLGLQDAVAHIVAEVEKRDLTGVVLVGHSWGAFPATGAAHRLDGRVAKVVYFSAPVPTPGTSQNDLVSPENAEYARSLAQSTPDHTMALPFQAFQQVMMQDEPERAQRIVFDQLLPQPGKYMSDPLDVAEVTTLGLPTAYILAQDDLALPLPGAQFAARLGAEPILIPGTHEAALTHPDHVTRALLSA